MTKRIQDQAGRTHAEGEPGYDNARIENLEATVRDLMAAVVDLQHRLARVDNEEPQWPGDTYPTTHTQPFE